MESLQEQRVVTMEHTMITEVVIQPVQPNFQDLHVLGIHVQVHVGMEFDNRMSNVMTQDKDRDAH